MKKSFGLSLLGIGLGLVLTGRVAAQSFSTLYNFTGGTDGAKPLYGGLLLSSNRLYGTAANGGDSGLGTVFAVNVDGAGFTNLYSFSGTSDGANPHATLTISGNTLYGTVLNGGAYGNGTVFAVDTDGTGFRTLHAFTATSTGQLTGTNSDGVSPASGLFLSGNTLYGTSLGGGSSGNGTVFKVNADGTGFATLHSFSATGPGDRNSDGIAPVGGLILSGNTLYGTASGGGGGGYGGGTVFALNSDGTGFRTLHSFSATTCGNCANTDGAVPSCALLLLGHALYGTASGGGSWGSGVVFGVNTDGTGFTVLHSFPPVDTHGGNEGGAIPKCESGLISLGNTLYGSTSGGGNSSSGTVFALGTNGASFTVLYKFSATSSGNINADGASPFSGLVSSANVLYGAATYGGSSNNGTIFSISLPATPPQLGITTAGPNIILSWPTNATGYILQSTTNLAPPVWTTNSPAPVVLNGQNTATNPISGTRQFFRLSQ